MNFRGVLEVLLKCIKGNKGICDNFIASKIWRTIRERTNVPSEKLLVTTAQGVSKKFSTGNLNQISKGMDIYFKSKEIVLEWS